MKIQFIPQWVNQNGDIGASFPDNEVESALAYLKFRRTHFDGLAVHDREQQVIVSITVGCVVDEFSDQASIIKDATGQALELLAKSLPPQVALGERAHEVADDVVDDVVGSCEHITKAIDALIAKAKQQIRINKAEEAWDAMAAAEQYKYGLLAARAIVRDFFLEEVQDENL